MRWSSSSRNVSQARGALEALLASVRFLRIKAEKSGLEVQQASSFGSAVSGSEEALWWLLSQLLRYFFYGICGNELEGSALVAWGQKSLFPHWWPFCYHIYRCGAPQKGHLGCSSLYDWLLLLRRGLYSGTCMGAWKMDVSPASPTSENISRNATLLRPWWYQRKRQIKQRSWW